MRVIRPAALTASGRRRPLLLALSMLAAGILALELAVVGPTTPAQAAVIAAAAAIGLGVGTAWLLRAARSRGARSGAQELEALLAATFDDSYTLILAPRLPIREAAHLDGMLVGPAGVRVLTVRDWEGRYRVRGRLWEFDAGGGRGWIRCRTNPSFEASGLGDGVSHWMRRAGLAEAPISPAVVFPRPRSRVVLEEPADEVVTADNAPWWANSIGRVRRLDAPAAARIIETVLEAADPSREYAGAPVAHRSH